MNLYTVKSQAMSPGFLVVAESGFDAINVVAKHLKFSDKEKDTLVAALVLCIDYIQGV